MGFQVLSLGRSRIGGVFCPEIGGILCSETGGFLCSGIDGLLWEGQGLLGFLAQGLVTFSTTFSVHWTHGLGWEDLSGIMQLWLVCHCCGAALGGWRGDAVTMKSFSSSISLWQQAEERRCRHHGQLPWYHLMVAAG